MRTTTTSFVRLLILSILVFQTLPIKSLASGPAGLAYALPEAKAGDVYEFTIKTEGGRPPFRWNVIEGTLPPGIELNTSGTLRGTPTIARAQGYEFTLQVSDSSEPAQTYAQKFAVVVAPGALRMVLNSGNKLTIVPALSRETFRPRLSPRALPPRAAAAHRRPRLHFHWRPLSSVVL